MDRPVRVLMIGAGRNARGHLRALQKMPELGEVVAAADPSDEARQSVESECGVSNTFADVHEAIAQAGADAAMISVPNFLHAGYVLAALNAGMHVFVEKPMALTLKDVDEMVGTAEAQEKLLMVGQSLRFVASIRCVKKLLEEGTVGTVRHVLHRRLGAGRGGDPASWFAKQDKSGGILPGIGSHSLDVLLWWLGEKAKTVYAVVQNIDPHPEVDIEDEVSLVATMESGAMLNMAQSFHHTAGTDWIIAGTEGVIHLTQSPGQKLLVGGEERPIPERVDLPGEHEINREFLGAIREGRPLAQASGREVRESLALVFAAQESGRTGKAVAVP